METKTKVEPYLESSKKSSKNFHEPLQKPKVALQTGFEKRIIEVVEFLDETKHIHQKFKYKKDLLEKLGLSPKNWSGIASGHRNIPDIEAKANHIRQYLINEYDINPAWLDRGHGKMRLGDLQTLEEPKTEYTKIQIASIEHLSQQLLLKDKIISELEDKNRIQAMLITSLQEQLKTSKMKALGNIDKT